MEALNSIRYPPYKGSRMKDFMYNIAFYKSGTWCKIAELHMVEKSFYITNFKFKLF